MKNQLNMAQIEEIQENNDLETVWCQNLGTDFEQPISLAIKKLQYSDESGWGKHSEVDVPEGATYLDLWKLCDMLVRESGDMHHIFLESFIEKDKDKGLYTVCLGS